MIKIAERIVLYKTSKSEVVEDDIKSLERILRLYLPKTRCKEVRCTMHNICNDYRILNMVLKALFDFEI